MKRYMVFAISVLGLPVLVGGTIAGALIRGGAQPQSTHISSGLEISMFVPELASKSDIVVRGIVVGKAEEERRVPDRDMPPGESRPQIDRTVTVQTFKVQVDEYLRGSGPETVAVSQTKSDVRDGKDKPLLAEGDEYFLFLFTTFNTAGSTFWGDAYLIQGPTQGYWTVQDGRAERPLGQQISMPLGELRQQVSRAGR